VYLNGVKLLVGTDFTATNGTSITLASGASVNDVVDIVAYGTFVLADHYTRTASDARYVNVTGDSMTGDLSFGDNDKAIFGAGSDLQIYHDSSVPKSVISEQGGGPLELRTSQLNMTTEDGSSDILRANATSVKLYGNNAVVLNATSTGIDVTGTVTSDGLTVDGIIGTINGTDIDMDGTASGQLKLDGNGYGGAIALNAQGMNIYTNSASRDIIFGTNETEVMRIDSAGIDVTGTISIDNTTGSPDQTLLLLQADLGTNDRNMQIKSPATDSASAPFRFATGNSFAFEIDSTTDAFVIADNARIGIGTDTPDTLMELVGANPILTIRDTDTGISTNDARLRLAESGASSSLDNYFDLMYNADKFRISSNTAANAFAIDRATGKVGISQPAPAALLHIGDSSNSLGGTAGNSLSNLTLQSDTSNTDSLIFTTERTSTGTTWTSAAQRMQRKVDAVEMGYMQFGNNTTDLITFGKADTERARLDGDGNFLLGKTAVGLANSGVELREGNASAFTRDSTVMDLNRLSAYGQILRFRKDGATKGSITIPATDNFSFIGENGNATIGAGDTGLIVSANESIRPFNPATNSSRDSAIGLGESYAKFTDVWAVDGSINTSDGNEKQDIASLTATEMLVAKRISVLFKTFKWKTAVEKKGDDARTHTGVIAQDVQAAFTAEGLDAGDYAMFMSDTWWETQTEVPAVEAGEDVEAKDAYTRTDIYDTEAEAPEGATERTRLGIRYHELLCFVSAYNEQRFATLEVNQTAIEARLTALEAV
jgi:hypothetical protein